MAGLQARILGAFAREHARAEAQGNDRVIGQIERRFDNASLGELRRDAGKLRRRYNAILAEWVIGNTGPAGRVSVRGALRSTTAKRRKVCVMQSLFLALGDHLHSLGFRASTGVLVNRVLMGDVEPQDWTMAVGLRFYRRLKGECSGCGGNDARDTGAVCGECGL